MSDKVIGNIRQLTDCYSKEWALKRIDELENQLDESDGLRYKYQEQLAEMTELAKKLREMVTDIKPFTGRLLSIYYSCDFCGASGEKGKEFKHLDSCKWLKIQQLLDETEHLKETE
jgi:hypothetical protein